MAGSGVAPNSVTVLDPVHEVIAPPSFAGPDHPMRKVTRGVAFDHAWDTTRRDKVAALFDSMASTWSADHDSPERYVCLTDALDRGFDTGDADGVVAQRAIELGSGSGLGTSRLAGRVDALVAFDLSMDMLRAAPAALAPRVRADASQLPIGDDAADLIVLVNMLLFPAEVDRVLATNGSLVWVNTGGDQTPIHLSFDDVIRALPGEWAGTASHAGTGSWLVARRSRR